MKICFFIYNISNPGGSERVTTIIANELYSKGYDISILSICGDNKSFYPLNKNIAISTIYFGKNNINSKNKYIGILKGAYKYHKNNKTEVVVDVFVSRSLISIPLKLFLKIKNISWEHFNYSVKEGLNPIARKLACRYSNLIITLTKEDTNFYKKYNKDIKASIDYIYNPSPFQEVKSSNLHNNNVITVGRLTYQKGYDLLLDSWKIIEKYSDWKLLIIGDGEEKNALINKTIALKLNNVEFIGTTTDVASYYKKSSMYVSSSRFEGLPMCMIEAQSFGLPIIAFNCTTGPSEIVKENYSGYLVDQDNVKELSKKILELINNKDKLIEFSQNAKIESKRFNIDNIMDKWEKVIASL